MSFMRVGLTIHKVGEIDFLSPVEISDRNVAFRNI